MHNNIRSLVLGIVIGSVAAMPATAQESPQQPNRPKALTESQLQGMENLGSLVGKQAGEDAQENEPVYEEGATEHTAGRVKIGDKWYDAAKVTGGKQDAATVDRAGESEAAGDMEDLRELHDEVDAEIAAEGETTARSKAYRATHDSDEVFDQGRQMVNDTNWDNVEQAFEQADEGMLGEDTFPHCETTRTVIPGSKEVTVTDQEVCEKVVMAAGDENGVACTRDRVCEARNDDVTGERTATLTVSQDVSAQMCSRNTEVEAYRDELSMTTTGTLDITEEVGGLSCRRTIWPAEATEEVPNYLETTVSVNNEEGGLICQRHRTVTGGGSAPVSGTTTGYSNAAYGQGIQTWTEDLSSVIPAGTVVTNVSAYYPTDEQGYSYGECNWVYVQVPPSAANNYVATMQGEGRPAVDPRHPLCDRPGQGGYFNIDWSGTTTGDPEFSVTDNGNCAVEGSANCPAAWSCTQQAPTTINGISVTAAQVQALGLLYPGAPNTCTAANKSKTCSGNADTNNEISIAHLIPAGTTNINGFVVSVLNPQAGVSVTATQNPTQANGWIAKIRVRRSSWSSTPANPQIRLSWNALVRKVNTTIQETGNCSDPGSTACPTQWSCESTAPHTVNGISVTAAMAAAEAPLFPGAASNCVVGALSRVCDGSSSINSGISIAVQLPPGTTDISDFQWTWDNPDPSLTVVLVEAPSNANGWVATFKVTRQYGGGGSGGMAAAGTVQSLFEKALDVVIPVANAQAGGVPPKPSVTLTWKVPSEERYRLIVAEEGDCSSAADGGFCPLQWTCNAVGPGTLDGHDVTISMLEDRGPLYPEDVPPRCLDADLSTVCSGDGSVYTEVDLSPDIPDYVDEIRSYQWEVITPSTGLNITQVQAPTKENGWKAIFRTDRTDWTIVPEPPDVHLTWVMNGETYYECEIQETGDCSVTSDEFCDASWTCTREVEDPVEQPAPTKLSSVETAPQLFAYATPGVPLSSVATMPNALIPAGTIRMDNFHWKTTGYVGTGACEVNVTGNPTPGNPNTNVTVINGTGSTGGGGSGPGGYWTPWETQQAMLEGRVDFPVHFAERMLDAIFPAAYAAPPGCGVYIVFSWDNIGYSVPPPDPGEGPFAGDIEGEPPLFEGDGGHCTQAELGVDCDAIWVGEECYINSDGEEVCVDQPPSETPDTCGELEADENCTLVREECTEGGQSSGGWCYVRSYLYECTRAFEVPDPVVTEETVCTEGTAGIPTVCMDDDCREDVPDTTTHDVLEPAARMMIIQHQMKDYKRVNTSPNPPGGGGGPGIPDVPVVNE